MVTFQHEQGPLDEQPSGTPATGGFLVGYDGSREADLAVRWAAAVATAHGQHLRVLVVAEPDDLVLTPDWPAHWLADVERHAHEALESAYGNRLVPDLLVGHRVGQAVPVLVEESERASVLVLGSRGHGVVQRMLLGSVSSALARRAHCPVVVVRPEVHPGSGRVVVGHDGSVSSRRATEFACQHAAATGQKLTVLRAHHLPATVPIDRRGDVPPALSRTLEREERALAQVAAEAGRRWPELTIETDVFPADAGAALVAASQHASMVVLGARSDNPVAETLLGTVSRQVLHEAGCPVAVVH